MLDGAQPRWPVPRLVAAVLSRRLQREVAVTDCGFVDRIPADDDPYDGLRCSGTLEGTVRTVVELSGRDMRRRKLLLGSVFSAAAFAEPALFALTVPPAPSTARAGGQRVGMADVEALTAQVNHLNKLGIQFGSGRVREQLVVLLNREANQLLHGSYTEKTGKALLSAVAQATRTVGYMSADVGRDALAQRYYIQALDRAMRAGDRPYAGMVLATMSRMTVRMGENASAEHDALRHGRQAVALARAGLSVAQSTVTAGLAAELHALEARGLAVLGEANAARRAALTAQRRYESVSPGDELPWQDFYPEHVFIADVGLGLSTIGNTQQALTLGATVLESLEPWRVRPRSLVQTHVALTHLRGRDLEQAAASGRDALHSATDVSLDSQLCVNWLTCEDCCAVYTLRRMPRERLTVSMEAHTAARVRQCGARTKGGASAYLENLVRQDALAEAAESAASWYAAHPGYAADSAAEATAALGETG